MTDRRRTCWCGHRYHVHATGGTQCLAVVDDPARRALIPCQCHEWQPRPKAERQFYRDVLRDAATPPTDT